MQRRQTFAEYLAIDAVDRALRVSIRDFAEKFSRKTINESYADRLFNNAPSATEIPDYFSKQVLGDEFERVFAMISNNLLSKCTFRSNEELRATLVTREWLQFIRKAFIKAIDDILDATGQFRPWIMKPLKEEGLTESYPALLANDEFKWSLISSYISMFICGAEIFQLGLSKANAALTFRPTNQEQVLNLYNVAKDYFADLIGQFKNKILVTEIKIDDKFIDRIHDHFDSLTKDAPCAIQVDERHGLSKSSIAEDCSAREGELLDLYGTEIYELAQRGESAADKLIAIFLNDRYLIDLAIKNSKLLNVSPAGNTLDFIYHPQFQAKLHAGIYPGQVKGALTRCFTAAELQAAGYPMYLIECEHTTPVQREALVLSAVAETVVKLIAEVVNPFKPSVDNTTILLARKTLENTIEKSLRGKSQQFSSQLKALTKKYAVTTAEIEAEELKRYAIERRKHDVRTYLSNCYRTNQKMLRCGIFNSELLFPYQACNDIKQSVEGIATLFGNASAAVKEIAESDTHYLYLAISALRMPLENPSERNQLDETLSQFSADEFKHLVNLSNPDNQPHIAAFIKTVTELQRLEVGELPGNIAYHKEILTQLKAWLAKTDFDYTREEIESKTRECESAVNKLNESRPVCLAYIAARDLLSRYEPSSDEERTSKEIALKRLQELQKHPSIDPARHFEILKHDCEQTLKLLQLVNIQQAALEAEKQKLATLTKERDDAKSSLVKAEATNNSLQDELRQTKALVETHYSNSRKAQVSANNYQFSLTESNKECERLRTENKELLAKNKTLSENSAIIAAPVVPRKPKPSRLKVWLPRILLASLFVLGAAAIITATLYTAGVILVPITMIALATNLSIAGFALGGAMVGGGLIGSIINFCSSTGGKKHHASPNHQVNRSHSLSTHAQAAQHGVGGAGANLFIQTDEDKSPRVNHIPSQQSSANAVIQARRHSYK